MGNDGDAWMCRNVWEERLVNLISQSKKTRGVGYIGCGWVRRGYGEVGVRFGLI